MPVPNAEQVGDDTVPGTTLDVRVHALCGDAVGSALVGVVLAEKVKNASLAAEYLGNGEGVDELDHSVLGGGGEHAVRRQAEVKVFPAQKLIHQRYNL